jgi:hypothetical protein
MLEGPATTSFTSTFPSSGRSPTSRPLNLIRWPPRTLRCAHLEAVLELPRDQLQRPHPPGTGGLSPLRLLTPVVYRPLISRFLDANDLWDHLMRLECGSWSLVHLRVLAAG